MTEAGLQAGGGRGHRAAPPVEVELKYRLRDALAGERLLAAESIGPMRATSVTRTTQHEDRYVDTADGALARAGFAARLRTTAAGTTVTVKSRTRRPPDDVEHPIARRDELEGPAERGGQPRGWPNSDARSLILELCGDAPLVETVTIRQLRRRRELQGADATVELSLDEVDVVARSRVIDRFVELEVELLDGPESALTDLAAALATEPGLAPERDSKLETALRSASVGSDGPRDTGDRPSPAGASTAPAGSVAGVAAGRPGRASSAAPGTRRTRGARVDRRAGQPAGAASSRVAGSERRARRRSAAPARAAPFGAADSAGPDTAAGTAAAIGEPESEPPRLVVGKTPGVLRDDALSEAARKVLRFHFARMLDREAGTRSGSDPEDLHGMRVATRRMRAAWRIFGDAFRANRTKRYRTPLRSVASRLGTVRDLDVLIEAAESYRDGQGEHEAHSLAPLIDEWRARRDDARGLLVRELDSDGYRRFVDDFRDFVRTDGAGARALGPIEPHHVRDNAASRIQAAFEKVRAYEPVLRWSDVETLHELRIAAKWLRYSLEFVREALGPETGLLIERVVALQDHLGMLHDADVAASLARTFLVEHSEHLSPEETAAIGRYLVQRERDVARLRRTVGTPWRGVAGLAFRRRLGRSLAAL